MVWARSELSNDPSFFEDPKTRAVYNQVVPLLGKDDAKIDALVKDISKYFLEQATAIMLPQTYNYGDWWPWIKDYHGEGFEDGGSAPKYLWIDQALRKSMGY